MRRFGFRSALALAPVLAIAAAVLTERPAAAQVTPPPERDRTWNGVTNALAFASLGTAALMPRIFYPSPEVTVGWKARWHLSVLAPVMTYATLAFVNEVGLKEPVKSKRPGCDDTNVGVPGCQSFGGPSSHAFAAMATLGHGVAVLLVDATKWSDGRVNALSVVGNVGVPLVLGIITVAGRAAGNFENTGQIVAGGTLGIGVGFLTGLTYAMMARPECGYSGAMLCW